MPAPLTNIEKILIENHTIAYKVKGDSMRPTLEENHDVVIIRSLDDGERLQLFDIPLYKRENGKLLLHRVVGFEQNGDYIICGDNRWGLERHITRGQILGKLIKVQREGKVKEVAPSFWWCRVYLPLHRFYLRRRAILRGLPTVVKHKLTSIVDYEDTQTFLRLLRAGLWDKPVSYDNSLSRVNWDTIATMIKQQTVGGIIASPIMSLMIKVRIPSSLVAMLNTYIAMNMKNNFQLNALVVEVLDYLKREGFRPILLKGQSLAALYHSPNLRQAGDIDLYIGEKDYEASIESIKRLVNDSVAIQRSEKNDKHFEIAYKGYSIELHKLTARLFFDKRTAYYHHLEQHWLERTEPDIMEINGKPIPVPPVTFNAFYIFLHLCCHFQYSGVGLRQLCDLTMFLHRHHKDIDAQQLQTWLSDTSYLKAWHVFAEILVTYLGLPEDECPLYITGYTRNAKTVLGAILREGNFGHHRSKPKTSGDNLWQRTRYALRANFSTVSRARVVASTDVRLAICFYGRDMVTLIKNVTHKLFHK